MATDSKGGLGVVRPVADLDGWWVPLGTKKGPNGPFEILTPLSGAMCFGFYFAFASEIKKRLYVRKPFGSRHEPSFDMKDDF